MIRRRLLTGCLMYMITGSAAAQTFEGAVSAVRLQQATMPALPNSRSEGLEEGSCRASLLEVNPFRSTSRPYTVVGVLVERVLGPLRLFVNGENLTNVRQTPFDSLLRPSAAPDGRWTVDAWSPLDGRNINGGVRLRF